MMNTMRTLEALMGGTPALTEMDAAAILGAMLDDGLPDLQHGALLALLDLRPPTLAMLMGWHRALAQRSFRLAARPGVRPVVLAAHGAARRVQINLLPALALVLQRMGLTVLVHGSLEGVGTAGAAHVFRELDVLPCGSLAQTQRALDGKGLAFVPTPVLAPGLARLMATGARVGARRAPDLLQRLLDPYAGEGLMVVATGPGADGRMLPTLFQMVGVRALLLEGTDGEPHASPHRRPALELVHAGGRELLFPAGAAPARRQAAPVDVAQTADWTRRALRGEVPLPLPLVNQVACCLYGAGCASDINQAKAIAALETGSLATA